MISSKILTSLTNDKIQKFLNDDAINYRSELACSKITGFHLRKLAKSSSWCYRYTDPSKKQRVMSLGKYTKGNQNEFAAFALEQEKLVLQGKDPQIEKQKEKDKAKVERKELELRKHRTVGNFFNDVYTPHKLKSRSGKDTLKIIKKNFEHLFDKAMEDLSVNDIREWEKSRKEHSVKRATLVRDFAVFKAMLSFAAGLKKNDPIDEPVIADNPLKNVAISKLTSQERDEQGGEQKNNRRQLTPEELKGIYKGLEVYKEELKERRRNSIQNNRSQLPDLDIVEYPHWSIPFTLIALYTGCRPGDLYGLKWGLSDNYINLEMKKIYIVPEKTRDHGDSPAKIVFPIESALLSIIESWWEQCGKHTSGFVFPSRSGKRLAKKSHNPHWKKIRKYGGLCEELDFYSFRHNFISTLVAKNVPLLHIAKLVGHKSTKMIEENYGHLSPMQASDAVRILSQSLVV